MSNSVYTNKAMRIRWFLLRFALVVYDILAVNFAYFLALLVRFYVGFEFNVWGARYIPAFMEFSPWYTICCLVVFYIFGLYKSMWKYAGMNDMNRIVMTSVVTCLIHVVGTLTFVMRMPITYYALGAAFQFVLIVLSRFSYRILLIEKSRFFKKKNPGTVDVMIVGKGEDCYTAIKHLQRDEGSLAHPVCVMDFSNQEPGVTMSGVPVINGIHNLPQAVNRYNVERVMLVDTSLSGDLRSQVRQICKDIEVDVQNFSGYFQTVPSKIPLNFLMEYVNGPVEILLDENDSSDKLLRPEELDGAERYIVASVTAKDGVVQIKLIRDLLQPNDIQADWVQSYRDETGGEISFF